MPDYFGPFLTAYALFLAFVLGACVGSFLDCSAGRYVRKVPYLTGRSRCDSCGATLDVLDLVPVVSYLARRGRCRHCGARIGPRCLVTETVTALVYLTTLWALGLSLQTVEALALESCLIWLALVDWDTMELPNGPMAAGCTIFLAFLPAHPDPVRRLWWGALGALAIGGGVLAGEHGRRRCETAGSAGALSGAGRRAAAVDRGLCDGACSGRGAESGPGQGVPLWPGHRPGRLAVSAGGPAGVGLVSGAVLGPPALRAGMERP